MAGYMCMCEVQLMHYQMMCQVRFRVTVRVSVRIRVTVMVSVSVRGCTRVGCHRH